MTMLYSSNRHTQNKWFTGSFPDASASWTSCPVRAKQHTQIIPEKLIVWTQSVNMWKRVASWWPDNETKIKSVSCTIQALWHLYSSGLTLIWWLLLYNGVLCNASTPNFTYKPLTNDNHAPLGSDEIFFNIYASRSEQSILNWNTSRETSGADSS